MSHLLLAAWLTGMWLVPVHAAPLPPDAPADKKPAPKPMLNAVSPDGKLILSTDGKIVSVADAQTQKVLIQIVAHTGKVTAVAFTPDGKFLVSGSEDKTVRLFDAATGKAVRTLTVNVPVAGLTIAEDSRSVTVSGNDQSTQSFDLATGAALKK